MIHVPVDPDWSRFVHLLVNVPRRFVCERPALDSLPRQGVMAHVLFVIGAGRPRVSAPVAAVPPFRLGVLAELLEAGELLRCRSERGSAHVAPVLLLDAVRQLPRRWREQILGDDPAAACCAQWLQSSPTLRPLTEVAADVLAEALDAGTLESTAEQLTSVARAFGLTAIEALTRGTLSGRVIARREPSVEPSGLFSAHAERSGPPAETA